MDGWIRNIAAEIVGNGLASADKTQERAEKKEIKTIFKTSGSKIEAILMGIHLRAKEE